MPESVRYLLSKGRLAEAEATVAQIERRALGRSLTAEEMRAAPKVASILRAELGWNKEQEAHQLGRFADTAGEFSIATEESRRLAAFE